MAGLCVEQVSTLLFALPSNLLIFFVDRCPNVAVLEKGGGFLS